ncbi:MAG: helix-turn-helix transcriptional regulator [Lachnospiraceae bacterium]|nr:helix-turn-helix transcriptional regulator [Lachnospiraceae bacterium]
MKFEEKLVRLRKARGFSQEELAEKLEVSRQAVSRWELGSTLPDIPNLVQLCELFGVTTDYLVREEGISDSSNQKESGLGETEPKEPEEKKEENGLKNKETARAAKELERKRYQARRLYYSAWAAILMAVGFGLAVLIDSKVICAGICLGQMSGAVIMFLFYLRLVKQIENEE